MPLTGRNKIPKEGIFFITTTAVNFLNVFKIPNCCDLLIKNIIYYKKKYNFRILAFVIMPSHFHWIIEPDVNKGTISEIMRDIKKYSAWDIMEYLDQNNKLNNAIFTEAAENLKKQNRRFWMKGFYDEAIRNADMLWSRVDYIHNNPIKAKLVEKPEDYIYSSAQNYICKNGVLDVDTEYAGFRKK